jgi:dynein heavy chain, axonemal
MIARVNHSGVAMMVPDFQIIMKVKLCSVGYTDFDILSQKFFVLYNTCKEQVSLPMTHVS